MDGNCFIHRHHTLIQSQIMFIPKVCHFAGAVSSGLHISNNDRDVFSPDFCLLNLG